MADFDHFDNNFSDNNAEEDPAAEFLAREQDELAGLDDYTFPDSSEQIGENGFDPGNGPISHSEPEQPQMMNGPIQTTFVPPKIKEEPEQIKKWREEQRERLAHKDTEEEKKQEVWKVAAKKELEEWYARQVEQLEKTKVNNRASEKTFLEERDADVPGLEWERIARLCDFNPKSSKNTKDISRMRSIILQLKQSPLNRC